MDTPISHAERHPRNRGLETEDSLPPRFQGLLALLCMVWGQDGGGILGEWSIPAACPPSPAPCSWGPPLPLLLHHPQRPAHTPHWPQEAADPPITVSWKRLLASPASLTATQA